MSLSTIPVFFHGDRQSQALPKRFRPCMRVPVSYHTNMRSPVVHATEAPVPSNRLAVIYDDACPMCTFQMRLLTWLDLGHRLTFMPQSSPEVALRVPLLKREALAAAMHALTPQGKVHRGARALRYLSARVVLLWPLSVLLWFPGVIFIAEVVYRFVSRHRQVLSKMFGCKGACKVLPERQR